MVSKIQKREKKKSSCHRHQQRSESTSALILIRIVREGREQQHQTGSQERICRRTVFLKSNINLNQF